ncbi:MAG: hypothetical protein WD120_03115 [Gemmatimonadota bacterium]
MAMSRGNLTLALLLLFLGLLGWYLVYTEQIVHTFREDTATMTRMFAEVQRGFLEPDVPLLDEDVTGSRRTDEVLWRLQEIILESGVPLILSGPGDTIQAVANLPFSADLDTSEGQERAREYARELATRNPPVGDPDLFLIHYGDPPELQRLRWTPWFQVVGLLLTVVGGFFLVRFQRRADEERAWASMARELAHQLGTPISSLKGWLEVLRIAPAERPGGMVEGEIAEEIGEDVERLERVSRRFELIGRQTEFGPLRLHDVVGSVERYLNTRIPRLGPGMRLEVEVAPSVRREVPGVPVQVPPGYKAEPATVTFGVAGADARLRGLGAEYYRAAVALPPQVESDSLYAVQATVPPLVEILSVSPERVFIRKK